MPFFFRLCFERAKDLLKEKLRRIASEKKENDELEIGKVKIQMENDLYSRELEEKLDQIHLELVKVCIRRAQQNNGNKRN